MAQGPVRFRGSAVKPTRRAVYSRVRSTGQPSVSVRLLEDENPEGRGEHATARLAFIEAYGIPRSPRTPRLLLVLEESGLGPREPAGPRAAAGVEGGQQQEAANREILGLGSPGQS